MSTNRTAHVLAVVSLSAVAVISIVGSMRHFPGGSPAVRFAPFLGLAIWSLLLWKIWKFSRKWGLGVGIFLFLMILFQTYLWRLALLSPRPEVRSESTTTLRFILYELPIFFAAICCLRLRFCRPHLPVATRLP